MPKTDPCGKCPIDAVDSILGELEACIRGDTRIGVQDSAFGLARIKAAKEQLALIRATAAARIAKRRAK